MKAKRDPFLDLIDMCTGGDGRLAENIDEALYGEEAFPTGGRFTSAKQVAESVKAPKDSKQHQRPPARKLRKRNGPESH